MKATTTALSIFFIGFASQASVITIEDPMAYAKYKTESVLNGTIADKVEFIGCWDKYSETNISEVFCKGKLFFYNQDTGSTAKGTLTCNYTFELIKSEKTQYKTDTEVNKCKLSI